eukprot:74327-Pelagomonas_calceolata.AAC.1
MHSCSFLRQRPGFQPRWKGDCMSQVRAEEGALKGLTVTRSGPSLLDLLGGGQAASAGFVVVGICKQSQHVEHPLGCSTNPSRQAAILWPCVPFHCACISALTPAGSVLVLSVRAVPEAQRGGVQCPSGRGSAGNH